MVQDNQTLPDELRDYGRLVQFRSVRPLFDIGTGRPGWDFCHIYVHTLDKTEKVLLLNGLGIP